MQHVKPPFYHDAGSKNDTTSSPTRGPLGLRLNEFGCRFSSAISAPPREVFLVLLVTCELRSKGDGRTRFLP